MAAPGPAALPAVAVSCPAPDLQETVVARARGAAPAKHRAVEAAQSATAETARPAQCPARPAAARGKAVPGRAARHLMPMAAPLVAVAALGAKVVGREGPSPYSACCLVCSPCGGAGAEVHRSHSCRRWRLRFAPIASRVNRIWGDPFSPEQRSVMTSAVLFAACR